MPKFTKNYGVVTTVVCDLGWVGAFHASIDHHVANAIILD